MNHENLEKSFLIYYNSKRYFTIKYSSNFLILKKSEYIFQIFCNDKGKESNYIWRLKLWGL